jgi:hypothetical protein
MTRNEFVRWLVLNEITDDFENVDQVILRNVSQTGSKCGLTIERSEVVAALASLVQDGLAKAYRLPSQEPLQGMPICDEIEEYFKTYFYVTKEGMAVHLADDSWWPLDEDQKLKKDWSLNSSC